MNRMIEPDLSAPVDGRQSQRALEIQRGTARLLRRHGFVSLPEMTLKSGRRADLFAINDKGEIWIVEIKSSIADFRADNKWPDYWDYCDRLFFATNQETPADIFPQDAGLIIADAHGAEILRDVEAQKLAAARRKAVTLRFAQLAAARLHAIHDPGIPTHIEPNKI
ncbi:MmcB family DNA repair protein [Cohaesibacter celericrescens]|uniref:DNA repair protein MmcB-related protein n=1 Tax=Cohaesibacter celericrescens TaxID=2067669 RepID=A0A2N5XUG6_9HYPH|nr:MmcB family DNA repair protein [Cohaesibacter celericrescens]PLW78162.1 DNA repair protein MmcB-related protein [Cohaesibacter celericrescens]